MDSFESSVIQVIENMVYTFKRKAKAKEISERIKRGRKATSASEFEEELAKLFEKHTPETVSFLVDYPLSFNTPLCTRAKTIYPDIAVIQAGMLVAIVEAKIDLGYLGANWANGKVRTITQLKAAGTIRNRSNEYSVSQKLDFATVILTARNHSENRSLIEPANPFFLLAECFAHPNDGRISAKDYIEEIRTHPVKTDWECLKSFVSKILD